MGEGPVLVAEFDDVDTARAAVVQLERRGVADANHIDIEGAADPARESTRRASDRKAGRFATRGALTGAAIGAVIGAVLGAGVTLLLGVDPQPAAPLGATLGAGAFGGAAGFFYGMASRLPVTGGAVEAVDPKNDGPVSVVVRLDNDTEEALTRPQLEEAGATTIERVNR